MKIHNFSTEEKFINEIINSIKHICKNKKGKINIALSGGSTPGPIYKKLGQTNLPFKRINFYQVDERYIPQDHKDSNYKLISETLQKPFHYFDTNLPIPQALEKYEQDLPEKFDLILLGMGPDGHTASLFPNSPALTKTRPVAHTKTERFSIKDRLTITFPPILNSDTIFLLIKGEEKATLIKKLENSTQEIQNFPTRKLIKHKNFHVFIQK